MAVEPPRVPRPAPRHPPALPSPLGESLLETIESLVARSGAHVHDIQRAPDRFNLAAQSVEVDKHSDPHAATA